MRGLSSLLPSLKLHETTAEFPVETSTPSTGLIIGFCIVISLYTVAVYPTLSVISSLSTYSPSSYSEASKLNITGSVNVFCDDDTLKVFTSSPILFCVPLYRYRQAD